jgi:hypothetical protein
MVEIDYELDIKPKMCPFPEEAPSSCHTDDRHAQMDSQNEYYAWLLRSYEWNTKEATRIRKELEEQ